MNIIIFGAAGFIGTNLIKKLLCSGKNTITIQTSNKLFLRQLSNNELCRINIFEVPFSRETDFESIIKHQDIVFHLVSTTIPATSNNQIAKELEDNVLVTTMLLEACRKVNIKKIIFISSGGTVYGKDCVCPLSEDMPTNPISSYGVQKITIEKLLYLYYYLYGLDYSVIRLSNPYGPYQRPNGKLGVITNFVYKALNNEKIVVWGDGSVVRDFIYIDDAVDAMLKITFGRSRYHVFNVGSGYGTRIIDLIKVIEDVMNQKLMVEFKNGRKADVPINYLDIARYEEEYGEMPGRSLNKGVLQSINFLKIFYNL